MSVVVVHGGWEEVEGAGDKHVSSLTKPRRYEDAQPWRLGSYMAERETTTPGFECPKRVLPFQCHSSLALRLVALTACGK
jgi:hypothetical protein